MFIPRPTAGGMLFLTAAAVALGSAFMNVGLITALAAALLVSFVLSGFLMSLFAADSACGAVRFVTDDQIELLQPHPLGVRYHLNRLV
ncbi:MAG: hypothetical protein IJH79_09770, partial [Lentisphaeria bacterium]|nr:hypothetical protein [Lentisphaeria bacterium]